VAERAGAIAMQTHQRLVGVVENMSWLELPTGEKLDVFGTGGGAQVSEALTKLLGAEVPLLGQVPLDTRLRQSGDEGKPLVLTEPDAPASKALRTVADRVAVRRDSLLGKPLGLSPAGR
ncbi:MAG: P-loop NTPase, partial [Dehalococcoidia bacterium]